MDSWYNPLFPWRLMIESFYGRRFWRWFATKEDAELHVKAHWSHCGEGITLVNEQTKEQSTMTFVGDKTTYV